MQKLRSSYPIEINLILLVNIFLIASFSAHQLFVVDPHAADTDKHMIYFGMILVGIATVLMVVIVWEEMLFHLKVLPVKNGVIFRNHRTKLNTQILIYLIIPAIFAFIYSNYTVDMVHFGIWATICMIPPVIEKIITGINNYNDYLKLTGDHIEFKNNRKTGNFQTNEIENITIIKDDEKVIKKIQLSLRKGENVMIDLDEMELEDFYESIYKYLNARYKNLIREIRPIQPAL